MKEQAEYFAENVFNPNVMKAGSLKKSVRAVPGCKRGGSAQLPYLNDKAETEHRTLPAYSKLLFDVI